LCLDRGCELQDLPVEELQQIHPAFDRDFAKNVTLDAVLSIHDVPGGTAGDAVKEALARAEQRISKVRGEVHAHA